MLVNKVLDFPIILKVNHSPQAYCFEVRACGSKGLMAVLPPWGLTFHFLAKPGETGINKHGVFKAEELLCQSHFESFNYFLLSKREGTRQELSETIPELCHSLWTPWQHGDSVGTQLPWKIPEGRRSASHLTPGHPAGFSSALHTLASQHKLSQKQRPETWLFHL